MSGAEAIVNLGDTKHWHSTSQQCGMIRHRRYIDDFSNWNDHSRYQQAFERLLRDLKATEGDVVEDIRDRKGET